MLSKVDQIMKTYIFQSSEKFEGKNKDIPNVTHPTYNPKLPGPFFHCSIGSGLFLSCLASLKQHQPKFEQLAPEKGWLKDDLFLSGALAWGKHVENGRLESMLFLYIWLILMVNVGKYSIYGSYGF